MPTWAFTIRVPMVPAGICCSTRKACNTAFMASNALVTVAGVPLKLGSVAAPHFMRPEGVVVFHVQGNVGFKKTIEKDQEPKSLIRG